MANWGLETAGATAKTGDNGYTSATDLFAFPATGDITSITNYVATIDTSAREIIGVIYDDSGGNADILKAQSAAAFDAAIVDGSPDWISINITYAVTLNELLHAGFQQEFSSTKRYVDTGTAYDCRRDNTGTFGTPPSPFSSGFGIGERGSCYVTYTADGGGGDIVLFRRRIEQRKHA